jgi:hypothetical protein
MGMCEDESIETSRFEDVEVWKLVDTTKRIPLVGMKVSSREGAKVSTLEGV